MPQRAAPSDRILTRPDSTDRGATGRGPRPCRHLRADAVTHSYKIFAAAALAAGLASSLAAPATLAAPVCAVPGAGLEPQDDGLPSGTTRLSARSSRVVDDDVLIFEGDAVVTRDDMRLRADQLRHNRSTRDVSGEGNVHYSDRELLMRAARMEMNLRTEQAEIENASYALRLKSARGQAVRVIRHEPQLHTLHDASYTTCPPGDRSWQLKAGRAELDGVSDRARARNVVVNFKGVPIAYTPYLSYSLDRSRKSGFLFPTLGHSDDSGGEVRVPYYFNLAPNYDATVAALWLEDRGTMAEGTLRYLTGSMAGELSGSYLPNDDIRGENRSALFWQHEGAITPRWTHRVDLNDVSDTQYFEDFGNDLASTSTTHLVREAQTAYTGRGWRSSLRVQTYETLEGTDPVNRLPEIITQLRGDDGPLGLSWDVGLEASAFDHETQVDGWRFDVDPRISLPMRSAGAFLIPQVGARYTWYRLDDQMPGFDDRPDRLTPSFSLDGGLIFERDLALWGNQTVQTLEPRAYYLYVPHREQDDIPLLDTGVNDFSFEQLFREDRFAGADRVGDANQLALAVTSRILSGSTGTELLRASIGTLLYFSDRDTQLVPGSRSDSEDSSQIVTEIAARLTRKLSTEVDFQWDPHASRTAKATGRVRYRGDDGQVLNLSYRMRRDPRFEDPVPSEANTIEQTDVSVAWPLGRHWSFYGRSVYSLREDRSLEALAGLGYESCCWALRLLHREYVKDETGDRDRDRAIMVQFVLKGLASVGSGIADYLNDSIPGFVPPDSRY